MQEESLDSHASTQYQIRRRLGEGGFGQVFEAWDSKLCRSVALKRLKALPASVGPDRLLDEARAAASLRHSAFVKIFSIDEQAEVQSIIMELVDGCTLRQFAGGQALPAATALDIVRQIAEAMQEAHAANLVHGDIKPSNLMIEPTGQVRILDFGLARQIDPLATQTGPAEDTQGTIAYMAPERLMGLAPRPQGDIYALGVILYELITGATPFAHLSGLTLAVAHVQSSSALWPFSAQCDPVLVALVREMTAKDAGLRIHSMQAVSAGIRALQTGIARPAQEAAAAAPRRWWPAPSPARRRRYAVALALAVAVLTLAVSVPPMWSRWESRTSPPFSEARTMRAGLDALRHADRDGSLDSAVSGFTRILERNPGHAAAAAGLSLAYCLLYFGAGRDEVWLQRADASAQLALKQDDQLALAHAARAWVMETQGHMDEALREAEVALSLDPLNLFALWGRADLLIRMRRFEAAQTAIDSAIASYPKERLFSDVLGRLHYQQKNYPAAERAFRNSIALDPDSVLPYASLSQVLLRQNRGDQALQTLQDGLQIRPNSRLYGNLGTTLFARGDYLAAARAFEQAVSAGKGGPGEYLNWANFADTLRWIPGRAADSRAAYQQAADLLKTLLARTPNNVLYLSRMGLYAARLGDRATALQLSQRAVLAEPSNADVHFRAAIAHEVTGDRVSAIAALKQARSLGYPANLIETEPDLLALRRDPRFHPPTVESLP